MKSIGKSFMRGKKGGVVTNTVVGVAMLIISVIIMYVIVNTLLTSSLLTAGSSLDNSATNLSSNFTSVVFIAIFSVAIISYIVQFGADNNSAVRIDNDSRIQEFNSSLRGNMSSFRTTSNQSLSAQSEGGIQIGDTQTTDSANPYKVNMVDAFAITGSVFTFAGSVIFGNDSNFLVVPMMLGTLLAVLIGLYIYKFVKQGSPD